ncbi:MAG: phosphohydrolase [Bacillales bacterium]|jgi:predicted HD superfamily hydrolase involved in NAD metabolism|nr:phosphohydrolase [Bacillales bacterium]
MEFNEAYDIVKAKLPEKRFAHVMGVVETSRMLAKKYGADIKKAELAAIFHDYSKYDNINEMRQLIVENELPKDLLEYDTQIWHSFVGAFLVKRDLGIEDEEILNAIKFHTTGQVGMGLLEQIIFVADYIEPGRTFPSCVKCRQIAETSLVAAVLYEFENVFEFLLSEGKKIYPIALEAYEEFKKKYLGELTSER